MLMFHIYIAVCGWRLNQIVQEAYLLLLTRCKLMVVCLSTGNDVCVLLPNEIYDGCCMVQITSALYRANVEA